MNIRRLALATAAIIVTGSAYTITRSFGPDVPTSEVTLLVAPQKSTIYIDGKKADSGANTVPTGTHTVKVEADGFSSKSETIKLEENDTLTLGYALMPNTSSTAKWYAEHPEDKKLAEGIGSKLSDSSTDEANSLSPIFNIMPISYGDGRGGVTSFGSGISKAGSRLPAIHISSDTVEGRADAVKYITSRGYDPSGFETVFEDEVSTFGEFGYE